MQDDKVNEIGFFPRRIRGFLLNTKKYLRKIIAKVEAEAGMVEQKETKGRI